MPRSTKNYSPDLKSKVALAAYKGEQSLLEISSEYKVPKTNIRDWLNKLKSEVSLVFSGPSPEKTLLKEKEKEVEKLHKIIGELTVENNYLKKKLG